VYDAVSHEYERGRPSYAPAAVAHVVAELGLSQGAPVLDLGAGTGKLTRLLAAAGLAPIALDVSAPMLAKVSGARTVVGRAEAIPLPDGSVAAVTAAQAFHWFDAKAALPEIHRVLEPGGGLALIWNRRDESDPVQRLLAELTDPPERGEPRGWQLDIAAIVGASRLFDEVATAEFRHVQTTDVEGLVSRLRSSSYVASLPEEQRGELERRLRHALASPGPELEVAHTTIVHLVRRS
jgi:SAM-dependent methyltransferase